MLGKGAVAISRMHLVNIKAKNIEKSLPHLGPTGVRKPSNSWPEPLPFDRANPFRLENAVTGYAIVGSELHLPR